MTLCWINFNSFNTAFNFAFFSSSMAISFSGIATSNDWVFPLTTVDAIPLSRKTFRISYVVERLISAFFAISLAVAVPSSNDARYILISLSKSLKNLVYFLK